MTPAACAFLIAGPTAVGKSEIALRLAGKIGALVRFAVRAHDPDPHHPVAFQQQVIDRLLESTDYADYFANKWNAILRNKRRQDNDKTATFAFHEWIRQSLHENKPYDQFVREVVAASGEIGRDGGDYSFDFYMETKHVSLARGTHKIQRLGV